MEELLRHKFVVLDSGHFNSLGLVRSLGEYRISPILVVIGGVGSLPALSKYVKTIHCVKSTEEGIKLIINKYSNTENKTFLYTGSDHVISIIDKHFDVLKDNFYFFNCGEKDGINKLLSKRVQNEIAKGVGFNVPNFEEVDVGTLPTGLKYPLITKAVNSLVPNWKSVTYLCRSEEELMDAYTKISCDRVLLQEYIEKENETGFNGFSIKNGSECYLGLQLSYDYVLDTTFGNSIYLSLPTDNNLLKKIESLISQFNYSGLFSIDLLISKEKENGKNKIYFLEVNFRNSGWSYAYTQAGLNLPGLWAKSTKDGHIDVEDMKYKRLPFHTIIDFEDLMPNIRKGFIHTVKYLYKILSSNGYIYWSNKDPKPFFYKMKGFVSNRFAGN